MFNDEKLVVENTHKNSGGDRRDRDDRDRREPRDRDDRRDRDRHDRRDRGDDRRGGRSPPSGKCFGCGETGHW